jgi:hypothetical protein
MSGYKEYNNLLMDSYPNRHRVPIMKATEDNFKQYGRFVYDYDSEQVIISTWPQASWRKIMDRTGRGGGIAEGRFEYWWDDNKLMAVNNAVGGSYTVGILPKNVSINNRTSVLTREANYHPDGGQVFYPLDKNPFVLLLALPGDDINPEDFVAFYFSGECGAQIYPNIWHQPVFPLSRKASFMTKQGKVHACVGVDTLEEFNKWLEIPLTCIQES